MSLTDDMYDPCDCFPEDGNHIDHWLYYINYARKAVHMEPVEWDYNEKGGE